MHSWNILKYLRLSLIQLVSLHGKHSPLLVLISLLLSVFLSTYTLIHFIRSEYILSLVSLFILSLLLANLLWLKRINDFSISSSIFLTLIFGHNSLALMHNHLAHVGIYWSALFPILAFMLKGRYAGMFWSTLMGGFLGLFLLLTYNGILSTDYANELLISLLLNYFLITIFSSLYCAINNQVQSPDTEHEQLHYMATRDELTGLLNRPTFIKYLTMTLDSSSSTEPKFALLFLDLDRFKQINDRHGHSLGDKVLKLVGKRLQRSVRSSDLICRYGGDEFLIMLQNISPANVQSFIAKINQQFTIPFVIDGEEITLGVSVGVSFCPHEHQSIGELIEQADREMYNNKKQRQPLQH